MKKTMAQWENGSIDGLTDFLQVGDLIDFGIYQHCLEILPPACNSDSVLQMGEAYDHRGANGQARFITLERASNGNYGESFTWKYTGLNILGGSKT